MTKRQFLESVSAVGGVSAMLTALNGWDMGIASAAAEAMPISQPFRAVSIADTPPTADTDSRNCLFVILIELLFDFFTRYPSL